MEERIIDPVPQPEEEPAEISLRPQSLDQFVGQEAIKKNLRVFIDAARGRSDALDHVLFHGSPGLGKTSLANIIANELGVNVNSTSGPVIERPGDLAAILTSLQPKDVLFIGIGHHFGHGRFHLSHKALGLLTQFQGDPFRRLFTDSRYGLQSNGILPRYRSQQLLWADAGKDI